MVNKAHPNTNNRVLQTMLIFTIAISFEIKAQTLAEAVNGYAEAAKAGVEETIAKIEAMRREAATKIVTPGDAGFAATANKIQMP